MAAPAQTHPRSICPRCRVNVPLSSKRCPECGERLIQTHNVPIYVGIAGVVTLLFIILLSVVVIRHEDEAAQPAIDPDAAPISAPVGSTPEKPPPLNK